jgi:hypothetical protein
VQAMLDRVHELSAGKLTFSGGSIVRGNDMWTYDTVDEWLAEYSGKPDGAGISSSSIPSPV